MVTLDTFDTSMKYDILFTFSSRKDPGHFPVELSVGNNRWGNRVCDTSLCTLGVHLVVITETLGAQERSEVWFLRASLELRNLWRNTGDSHELTERFPAGSRVELFHLLAVIFVTWFYHVWFSQTTAHMKIHLELIRTKSVRP